MVTVYIYIYILTIVNAIKTQFESYIEFWSQFMVVKYIFVNI